MMSPHTYGYQFILDLLFLYVTLVIWCLSMQLRSCHQGQQNHFLPLYAALHNQNHSLQLLMLSVCGQDNGKYHHPTQQLDQSRTREPDVQGRTYGAKSSWSCGQLSYNDVPCGFSKVQRSHIARYVTQPNIMLIVCTARHQCYFSLLVLSKVRGRGGPMTPRTPPPPPGSSPEHLSTIVVSVLRRCCTIRSLSIYGGKHHTV